MLLGGQAPKSGRPIAWLSQMSGETGNIMTSSFELDEGLMLSPVAPSAANNGEQEAR